MANQITLGSNPSTIFINGKNSIYTINEEKRQILVWHGNNNVSALINNTDFYKPSSLFVTSNGDIYIDNGEKNGRVEKWIASTNQFSSVLYTSSSCKSLFVDRENNLYCSMSNHHHVTKRSLHNLRLTVTTVAGTGIPGSSSIQLHSPRGIYVDARLDLYVADCGNNRVQLYGSEELDVETVAGRGSSSHTISLDCPIGITLDAQNYLFIVDSNNHRIIRVGSNDVRCVIGCYGSGSQSAQLFFPSNIGLDSFGNMFVVDTGNSRIQKFQYLKHSCGKLKKLQYKMNSNYKYVRFILDMSSVIQLTYSFTLNKNSQMYSQDCNMKSFYYEAFEMNVPESRTYAIWSNSRIDTYGYVYENNFDPLNPTDNLFTEDDDGASNDQFRFEIPLYVNATYILVVTTYSPQDMGEIEIKILGLKDFNFTRLSK